MSPACRAPPASRRWRPDMYVAVKGGEAAIANAHALLADRTTLPRFGYTRPIDTAAMQVERRVSATYKDLPGGQLLGPTFDYTHRLLDPELAAGGNVAEPLRRASEAEAMPRVSAILARE